MPHNCYTHNCYVLRYFLSNLGKYSAKNSTKPGNFNPYQRIILGIESCLNDNKPFEDLDRTKKIEFDYSGIGNSVNVEINVQEELISWYKTCWNNVARYLQLMTIENSIQFVYQLAITILEYYFANLWEISDNIHLYRAILAFRIISIALSAGSIFTPIIQRQTILACTRDCRPSLASCFIKHLQICVHLAIGTGIVFLLRLENDFFLHQNQSIPTYCTLWPRLEIFGRTFL